MVTGTLIRGKQRPLAGESDHVTLTPLITLDHPGDAHHEHAHYDRYNSVSLQPTLSGATLLLRPLQEADREALFIAASDPLIWEQHPDPNRWQRPSFDKYFDAGIASGGALAVINRSSDTVIGSSRFYQWNPEKREIFIGFTFLARDYWGGTTNREMKQLMLDHAFEFADSVWFHVGKDNLRSRKAMEKIGACYSHEAKVNVTGVAIDYVFYRMDRPTGINSATGVRHG